MTTLSGYILQSSEESLEKKATRKHENEMAKVTECLQDVSLALDVK